MALSGYDAVTGDLWVGSSRHIHGCWLTELGQKSDEKSAVPQPFKA